MPKMTNVETGEEVEISMEELLEALENGTGGIQQIVTRADGTKQVTNMMGNIPGQDDGYDHTLIVYMKMADLGVFTKMLTDGKIDTEDIEDPCDMDDGFIMTVDFTDMAATSILKKGEGRLSLESYVRDDRRTYSNKVDSICGEYELEADGSLSLDEKKLKKNKFLVIALGFIAVRKYLLTKGIVQKLYKMYDGTAGATIRVTKDEKVSAKVVSGEERPDLPCDVFLLGEQMCRPYMDELLGIKPKAGNRPKRDPEVVAQKKAEKEEREREKNKKDLANKRRKLTQTNNKLAELTDQKNALEKELEAEAPKEAEYKEKCSLAEGEYTEKKREIQNRINELEASLKSLDSVRTQEVGTYNDAQRKNRGEKEELIKELKKAQALFEVKQEMADIYKEKAEKGGGKKKTARYTEKREEAKTAKQVVDGIVGKIDDIDARQKEEDVRHKNNEDSYVAQKQQIESELSQNRSALNEVNSAYEREKSECDAYVKTLDAKRNELKDVTKQISSIKKEVKQLEQEIEVLEKA